MLNPDDWNLVDDVAVRSAPASPVAPGVNAPQIEIQVQEVLNVPAPMLHQYQAPQAVVNVPARPPSKPATPVSQSPVIVPRVISAPPSPSQPVVDRNKLIAAVTMRAGFR